MEKENKSLSISRRSLLGGVAALGTATALKTAGAEDANPDNLPPNVPEWTPYLGSGGGC